MKETRFKTLMHCEMYVDMNSLDKGIYHVPIPYLFGIDMTIETMEKSAIDIQNSMGKHHVSEKYFENLKECKLVEVSITEHREKEESELDKLFQESTREISDDYIIATSSIKKTLEQTTSPVHVFKKIHSDLEPIFIFVMDHGMIKSNDEGK